MITATETKSEPTPAEKFAAAVKGQLAKFDTNLSEVNLGIKTLNALVVIDQAGRDKAYETVTQANKARILIENRRKELVKPWNDLVATINAYAKVDLTEPLQKAIQAAETKILTWDKAEQAKRDAEIARLAKQKEEAIRKQQAEERQRQEAAAAEQRRIDEEARKATEAIAESLKGIARAKAIQAANEKAEAERKAAEERAAQEAQAAKIDAALERVDIQNKTEDLEAVKVKGAKEEWDFEVMDINLVPAEYVKKEILRAVTLTALKAGMRNIPGLRIFAKESLTKR